VIVDQNEGRSRLQCAHKIENLGVALGWHQTSDIDDLGVGLGHRNTPWFVELLRLQRRGECFP
jgi:hypothetical protein